jgi:hypothetical protein
MTASCAKDEPLLPLGTPFLFNYRSDCMRKISIVLGHLVKPVEVDIPKYLVSSSSLPCTLSFLLYSEEIDST